MEQEPTEPAEPRSIASDGSFAAAPSEALQLNLTILAAPALNRLCEFLFNINEYK